jgi:hypothetical protein
MGGEISRLRRLSMNSRSHNVWSGEEGLKRSSHPSLTQPGDGEGLKVVPTWSQTEPIPASDPVSPVDS